MAIKIIWFKPGPKVWWRNRWFDRAHVIAMTDVEREEGRQDYFYQGSYNRGVDASAGTHNKGAVDDSQSRGREHRRRKAKRGIVGWPRTRAQGFDPHDHNMLVGAVTASTGLRAQMISWANGRNGLANNRADDSGVRDQFVPYPTWDKKRVKVSFPKAKDRPIPGPEIGIDGNPVVTVPAICYIDAVARARKYGDKVRPYNSVKLLQTAINVILGKTFLKVDGIYGPVTFATFDFYRAARFGDAGALGDPGKVSLKAVFKEAGMNVQVWTKGADKGGTKQ